MVTGSEGESRYSVSPSTTTTAPGFSSTGRKRTVRIGSRTSARGSVRNGAIAARTRASIELSTIGPRELRE